MTVIKKHVPFGDRELTLETGEIARQASGAVIASVGDTMVLVTVVGEKGSNPNRDFFPLTVDYEEKTYAAGKIPGGFFKREGRPSEKATLTCRLIDRPLRPTFPKSFRHEVQVISTVLSLDPEIDPDMVAMAGASAAVSISGLPFNGPIGGVRVGYIDEKYVLNPTASQLEGSKLNLVVAGTEAAVLMVESEADELSEEVMLDAVLFGQDHLQPVIAAIKELASECGKPTWDWQPAPDDTELAAAVESRAGEIPAAYMVRDKLVRKDRLVEVRAEIIAALSGGEEPKWTPDQVYAGISAYEKRLVRGRILSGEARIDGRDASTVRDITTRVGLLPRTHGSALFTRGETQAIVTTTLGTGRDAQIIDALEGEYREPFMLHYNFPPFSVGEARRVGGPETPRNRPRATREARLAGGDAQH